MSESDTQKKLEPEVIASIGSFLLFSYLESSGPQGSIGIGSLEKRSMLDNERPFTPFEDEEA
jgi:hypothetical protein